MELEAQLTLPCFFAQALKPVIRASHWSDQFPSPRE